LLFYQKLKDTFYIKYNKIAQKSLQISV